MKGVNDNFTLRILLLSKLLLFYQQRIFSLVLNSEPNTLTASVDEN